MVVLLPTSMERGWYPLQCCVINSISSSDFRCIRIMGLWGIHRPRRVVPARMARGMGWNSHYSEGAVANCGGCGHVRGQMGREDGEVPV